mmetsp:Transcript_68675/g.223502  ORF Transcript_68675/g.223502 Transcript_68675/m.223502 type:complete len:212 (+) Transcript_68675:1313-1948(+)
MSELGRLSLLHRLLQRELSDLLLETPDLIRGSPEVRRGRVRARLLLARVGLGGGDQLALRLDVGVDALGADQPLLVDVGVQMAGPCRSQLDELPLHVVVQRLALPGLALPPIARDLEGGEGLIEPMEVHQGQGPEPVPRELRRLAQGLAAELQRLLALEYAVLQLPPQRPVQGRLMLGDTLAPHQVRRRSATTTPTRGRAAASSAARPERI